MSNGDASRAPKSRNQILDSFDAFVQREARRTARSPNYILPLFSLFSSADFCCGPPRKPRAVPTDIWRTVCNEYALKRYTPFIPSNLKIAAEECTVFIPKKLTAQWMEMNLFLEQFQTSQRLYQYLMCTVRMNQIAETVVLMNGRNGRRVLLIDIELHDRRRQKLYALCTPNDKTASNVQKWQIVGILTALKLGKLLCIKIESLPRGVRAVSSTFTTVTGMAPKEMKGEIKSAMHKSVQFLQMKCIEIKTRNKKGRERKGKGTSRVLTVDLPTFYEAVQRSFADDAIDVVPIVSMVPAAGKRNMGFRSSM